MKIARSAINGKLINEEYAMLCKYRFLKTYDCVPITEMSLASGVKKNKKQKRKIILPIIYLEILILERFAHTWPFGDTHFLLDSRVGFEK